MNKPSNCRIGCGACVLLSLLTLSAFGVADQKEAPEAALQAKSDHALQSSRIAEAQKTERQQALEQSSLRAETLFTLTPEQVDQLTRGAIRVEDILNERGKDGRPHPTAVPPAEAAAAVAADQKPAQPEFTSRLWRFLVASLLVVISSIMLYKKTSAQRTTK